MVRNHGPNQQDSLNPLVLVKFSIAYSFFHLFVKDTNQKYLYFINLHNVFLKRSIC